MFGFIVFLVVVMFINWARSESKTNGYVQEINRLNEQYNNLVEEHKRSEIDEANKMRY